MNQVILRVVELTLFKVLLPNVLPLLLSCIAPLTISLADAVELLTRIISLPSLNNPWLVA